MLTRDTGFVPETDFETGIAETIDWLKKEKCNENN
jgi:nucleoside-diphosphate-sugar epimerase